MTTENAYTKACAHLDELLRQVETARTEVGRLGELLRAERIEADRAGQLATMRLLVGTKQVVIDRRTKTTIWTREIGTSPGSGITQWRKDRWGTWRVYPSTQYRSSPTLQIEGEA